MPASGYKLFVTGDVLTAAQVNDYLMLQTVMVFANSAARTSALSAVLAEGLVSYLQDTNVVEIYTGAAWVSLDDPNAIQNTIVDAKGDLIAASAADTPARLAVGTNGQVLTAQSGQATGLQWATLATGSMTLLSTTSLTGATTTISSIDQTYTDLYMVISGVTNATANGDFRIAPNGTTNATSSQVNDGGQNSFTLKVGDYMYITFGTSSGNKITYTSTSNAFAVEIKNYASSTTFKPYSVSGSFACSNSGGINSALVGGGFNSTTAISSLVFSNSGGNLSTGTVLLYGVK